MSARTACWTALAGLVLCASPALADVIEATPVAPLAAVFPVGAPRVETQVVLSLVIDAAGQLESAVVAGKIPADSPDSFATAALVAAHRAKFHPSERDGHAIRSRVDYVVVFRPPVEAAPVAAAAPIIAAPATTVKPGPLPSPSHAGAELDEDYALTIEARDKGWVTPRGVGDLRIRRELLDAAPHQQTSEMLSAAPGFFVDHEDAEGLGNDVYLRGFDLEHGSGIEMRVGNVPINSPVHVQGQGYADANFIIPEVVRSIHVLEGPYDPRQGDSAIVGSAYFDLGVSERANEVKASYGSFNQARVVGVAAPVGFDSQTFAAFALRHSDGFGSRRASNSGTVNAQYGLDVGQDSHLRLLATAYGAQSQLPGVLRQSDVDSGAVDLYGRYPYYTDNQGVQSSRVIVGADFDTVTSDGAHFEFAPWVMWTNFLARENYTGNVLSSALDPEVAGGQGDLWETVNRETAAGALARLHAAPLVLSRFAEVSVEPGISLRVAHTEQGKSLLSPDTLTVWDRREDAALDTLDAGAYLDFGLRLFQRARLSGGVRADLLNVTVNDRLGYDVPPSQVAPDVLPGSTRAAQGVAVSPRVTAEYDLTSQLTVVASYGEGFRSLQATANVATSNGISGEGPSIADGGTPYSKVRSYEAGFRAKIHDERFVATASAFETQVGNELVFEATSGGYTTEGASVRRGVVGSVVVKPVTWLLASVAGSVASARFTTLALGVSRYVPNVPPVLVRADVTIQGALTQIRGKLLGGRVGVGYTFLGGRHLTDTILGPADHVLNGHAALRYDRFELGLEGYNLLARKYADDREYFVSNWDTKPGTALATPAVHVSAAPPLTLLGTLALFF